MSDFFEIFIKLVGLNGMMFVIFLLTFAFTYKYSVQIFQWIENRISGNKEYILEKCEFLFIEVRPDTVTYILLASSFGFSIFIFGVCLLAREFWAGVILGVHAGIIGWFLPRLIIEQLVKRRIKAYQNQMVDALTLLANGIRAGLSIPQALGMVAQETKAPISQEFNIVLKQNRIGVPLEECFEALAKRIPSEDNEMFVSSINILRETGGNLAETFDTIVLVIRERIRLQQKIDTSTAQGMFQGILLASMPFVLMVVFSLMDPEYLKPLTKTIMGPIVIFIAMALDLVGTIIILKIVKIKV